MPPRYIGHFLARTTKNSDLTDYYLSSSFPIRMAAEKHMLSIMHSAEFYEAQSKGVYSVAEFRAKLEAEANGRV